MTAAQQPAQSLVESFRLTAQRMTPEFKAALPPQIPVERFVRTTITAVQMQPALLDADRRTLLAACMRAAQDGLLPDGREAALVIFRSKGGSPTVQYMPMIAGLFKKARNSGEIASLAAHVVHANDKFSYQLGDDEKIEHMPLLGPDRGAAIAAYAIARTKDGAIYREVMSHADIEKVRKVSRARDDGPWVDWWEEMARKTVFRRLAKRLPSSADLESALEHDNEATGFVQLAQAAPAAAVVEQQPPEPVVERERGPTRARAVVADKAPDQPPQESAPMPSNRVRERLRRGAPISEIMHKPALSIHELALVLDLSMPFVYRMLENGIGPATFYIGRTRYVRIETLRTWLAERERLAEGEKKPAA